MRAALGIIADRERLQTRGGVAWANNASRRSGVNITEQLPNGLRERVREPNPGNDMREPRDAYIDNTDRPVRFVAEQLLNASRHFADLFHGNRQEHVFLGSEPTNNIA